MCNGFAEVVTQQQTKYCVKVVTRSDLNLYSVFPKPLVQYTVGAPVFSSEYPSIGHAWEYNKIRSAF
jgi:hypothetical protein